MNAWYDNEDNFEPSISVFKRQRNRPFCLACLTPGHTEEKCFLRGPNFRPKELTQRLNLFNKQKGDKPTPGTQIPSWNPKTPPPEYQNQTKLQKQTNEAQNDKNKK